MELAHLVEDVRFHQIILNIYLKNENEIEFKFNRFIMERPLATFFILIAGLSIFVSIVWFNTDATRDFWNFSIVFSIAVLLVFAPLIFGKWKGLHLYRNKDEIDIQGTVNKKQKLIEEKQGELARIYKGHINE
jgi:hypothetical protein